MSRTESALLQITICPLFKCRRIVANRPFQVTQFVLRHRRYPQMSFRGIDSAAMVQRNEDDGPLGSVDVDRYNHPSPTGFSWHSDEMKRYAKLTPSRLKTQPGSTLKRPTMTYDLVRFRPCA